MATALASRASSSRFAVRGSRSSRFMGRQVAGAQSGAKYFMKAGNWLPGSDTPSWLPDDLPGNFGFDPAGLAKDEASLKRFTESELIHCRWAMLGVAGALGVEVLGFGNWYDAPMWAVTGGKATWFGIEIPFDLGTLAGIEFIAIAAAEGQRNDEPDHAKKCYPGGAFDPLGFSKDAKNFESLKLKEIKNGRLAMLAFLGFIAQHAATGKTPLQALSDHLANPWGANFATNGVSFPLA